jgi:hypothetical protein
MTLMANCVAKVVFVPSELIIYHNELVINSCLFSCLADLRGGVRFGIPFNSQIQTPFSWWLTMEIVSF